MNDAVGAAFALGVLCVFLRMVWSSRCMRLTEEERRPTSPRVVGDGHRMVGPCLTQVEAVQAMFPDIPEPCIRFDLISSGSAEATCERILRDGFLPLVGPRADQPPPQFPGARALYHTDEAAAPRAPSARTQDRAGVSPNLISRYQLDDRVQTPPALSPQPSSPGWVTDPKDREAALRERKAQLILQARQRLAQRPRAA